MAATRRYSLLIVGTAYTPPVRFPRCDSTWTTLSAYNRDGSNLANLPQLDVWDCHDGYENKWGVAVYDIRRIAEHTRAYLNLVHGETFANQLCWMLATVAGTESPVASVTLFGCEFSDTEHANELQYVTYHIGYLRGIGVPVIVQPPSRILPSRQYGFEENSNE